LILAFSRCDFKLWNVKKKTVLYSSITLLRSTLLCCAALLSVALHVTLLRCIALCCAPLLSCSIAQEVGSWKSGTMNGNLTFSLLTNWINHFFFNTKHPFLQINPFKSKCSLKNSTALFLTTFLLSQIPFLFSTLYSIPLFDLGRPKENNDLNFSQKYIVNSDVGWFFDLWNFDRWCIEASERELRLHGWNTMSQGIHEVSPDKGHTLPILKKILDLDTKIQVNL